MKFCHIVVIAAAAIFSSGPLSIALADNLPAQARKVVPGKVAPAKAVPASVKKVVRVPYRHHHHRYVEAPGYQNNCFLFFCFPEAPRYHRHHHHYVEVPKYRHHHHYVQARRYHDDD
jgi:hypothetical protein